MKGSRVGCGPGLGPADEPADGMNENGTPYTSAFAESKWPDAMTE